MGLLDKKEKDIHRCRWTAQGLLLLKPFKVHQALPENQEKKVQKEIVDQCRFLTQRVKHRLFKEPLAHKVSLVHLGNEEREASQEREEKMENQPIEVHQGNQ